LVQARGALRPVPSKHRFSFVMAISLCASMALILPQAAPAALVGVCCAYCAMAPGANSRKIAAPISPVANIAGSSDSAMPPMQ